jgi:acyl carrier protein
VSDGAPLSFARFAAYLSEGVSLEPERFTEDARFDEDLGLDSFDLLELIVRIEEIGVTLTDEDVADVRTVGDLYQRYLSQANPLALSD